MDIIFTFVLGWISVIYASVFMQNKSYGALMVSLGALATMFTTSLAMSREMAYLLLLVGRVSFWGGFAVLGTFERDAEVERIRSSSWRELIMGKVPNELQKVKVSEKKRIAIGCFISVSCAIIFFLAGSIPFATNLLVIAVVFGCYYFWTKPGIRS